MGVFDNLFGGSATARAPTAVTKEPQYMDVDWKSHNPAARLFVRVLTLNEFADVEGVLDFLRDRNNVVVLKVKPRLVQEKMELKRALKRIQRTVQATGGDIAGVREDIIVITPPEVEIARATSQLYAGTPDDIALEPSTNVPTRVTPYSNVPTTE